MAIFEIARYSPIDVVIFAGLSATCREQMLLMRGQVHRKVAFALFPLSNRKANAVDGGLDQGIATSSSVFVPLKMRPPLICRQLEGL